jgi:isopropylmalate/homocitrate/citramalate synthase
VATPQGTVLVCEVGPRDGLQNEKTILDVARKVDLIDQLSSCGFGRIEAVSFVNPARVPQMADAEQVMDNITRRPGTTYSGLALNLRGAQRALDSGIDRINFAFAVTETFNQRNQGRRIAESLQELESITELARDAGVPCTATLGASFGCPFEGIVPVETVGQLAGTVAGAGVDEVVIADTIGVGVPTQVTDLVGAVREAAGDVRIGCHLHHTRNTGIANAIAAIDAGVEVLDASVGGAGGCPFAPKATGNVPTEDLVYVLHGMGHLTPVRLPELLTVARWLESELGHVLPGMVKQAGLEWHENPVERTSV